MDAAFAQTVLEHSPDALLLLAPDGSISFVNNAAEQLFGYPRAQLLGADYSLLLVRSSREDFHTVLAGLAGGTGGLGCAPAAFRRLRAATATPPISPGNHLFALRPRPALRNSGRRRREARSRFQSAAHWPRLGAARHVVPTGGTPAAAAAAAAPRRRTFSSLEAELVPGTTASSPG